MTAVHCIVPARMGSTRFPGKPLVLICGREMILRTLDRARDAGCFERIACATDSREIASLVEKSGYEAVMTGFCATGSDRVYEASEKLNLDLVVNLQGDEPVADLNMLRDVADALVAEPQAWVTASCPLSIADYRTKSIVKVKSEGGYAVQFSRVLPATALGWNTHRGIYAYSRTVREEFHKLPQTPEEKKKSLEQLRILGRRRSRVIYSNAVSLSVDLPSDVEKVERWVK